tara:strand:- start:1194 stop:1520 length:327 start_codon:yes stop_codon:yes gene_type:complete
MMGRSARGAPLYDVEAKEAFQGLLDDLGTDELSNAEKLLAALSLVREVRRDTRPGAHRCDSCERITYDDWGARQLHQVYSGLVSKLRYAVEVTESEEDEISSRPREEE